MSGITSPAQLIVSSLAALSTIERSFSPILDPYCLAYITFGQSHVESDIQSTRQHIHTKTLANTSQDHVEIWTSKLPVGTLQAPNMRCSYNNDLIFGVIEIQESAYSSAGLRTLEKTTQSAYTLLFEALEKYNYPYLWRVWNYLPDITGVADGLERYQQFNAGRQQGFADAARSVTDNVPAACALGLHTGPLSVAFLAGRKPTVPVENPRQISAYHYPKQYGLHSPTFSRASLATLGQQELLFISGTASIVGHQSLHAGDVRNQTLETLQNIQAVVDQANVRSHGESHYSLKDLNLRVYVRYEKDAALIQSLIEQSLGESANAIYLNADICRPDLDVEIEGSAWKNIRQPTLDFM